MSANVAPVKGDSPEGVRRLGEEVEKLGRQRLVLKSDQEPAIKALLQSVKRENIRTFHLSIPQSQNIRVTGLQRERSNQCRARLEH